MNISSLFDLSGKVAVVTGGGDGIGKGCCEILAAAGASVVVSDINADKAKAVADSIIAAGGKATPVACNVLEDADLVNLIDTTVKSYGTVNILVNNAGLGGGGRENPFKIDVNYVERIYRINVFAPWRLCQLAVPEMGKSGYGSIVNITSMSSIDKEPNMCVYSSSKAALTTFSAIGTVKRTVNSLPTPCLLSRVIVPPIVSTILFVIARPRPVPCTFPRAVSRSRAKTSKTVF